MLWGIIHGDNIPSTRLQILNTEENTNMGLLWAIIIGGIIGWIASLIIGRDIPGGILGNIIGGFIGAWLGSLILGDWGPAIAGFYLVPAIIGAIIVILIISVLSKSFRR